MPRMQHATTKQVLFSALVNNTPAKGSNDYPVAIKASDLDENYLRSTLVKSDLEPPLYDVEYKEDGTRITRIFPNGTNTGDLLYWNENKWVVFARPEAATMHALTITNGVLAWTPTEACEE
jgi:hypothetical protein